MQSLVKCYLGYFLYHIANGERYRNIGVGAILAYYGRLHHFLNLSGVIVFISAMAETTMSTKVVI